MTRIHSLPQVRRGGQGKSDAPPPPQSAIVLGVDPGSRATGYAVVAVRPNTPLPRLLDFGVLRYKEGEPHAVRLARIFEGLCAVIAAHRPGEAAVENVFHAANPRSALLLGQARGAALAAAATRGLEVFEYMPLLVKKTVTGYGRAGKEQVQRMAALLVTGGEALRDNAEALDASDALAVALCHLSQRRGAALAAFAAVRQGTR